MPNQLNPSDLVRDAFEFLKIEFGAESVPPPQVALDQSDGSRRFCYDPVSNIIFLPSNLSEFNAHSLRYMIGEETGHYIHHQITPQLATMRLDLNAKRKASQDDNERSRIFVDSVSIDNCGEFVASYAGLLYLKKMAGEQATRQFAVAALRKTAKSMSATLNNQDTDFNDEQSFQCVKHGFGYLNAINCFLNHGNRYLKAAARVDRMETINLMMKSPSAFLKTLDEPPAQP